MTMESVLFVRVDSRPSAPHLTKEQFEAQFKLDPEIRMQSRKLRFKNAGYLMSFGAWYVGCIYYIMHRLRSDDLETLEKEANERIRIKKQIQQQQNARD